MSSNVGEPFTAPFDGTSPITTVTGLGYAVKSLTVATGDDSGSTDGSSADYTQCQSTPFDPTSTADQSADNAYTVLLTKGFTTAWQNEAGEGLGATQGTQFNLAFTNVPANVTLYLPVSFNNNGVMLNLVATSPTLDKTKAYAAVPAGGAVYEVISATNASTTVPVPVYVSYNAGQLPGLTTSAAPVTVSAMYAPQSTNGGASGSKDPIPRFLGAAQSSSSIGFTIVPCNTTILFPYIVNQPGYDTGLAISNAGNLNKNGGQSGTCQWSFYGDNAPTTALPPLPPSLLAPPKPPFFPAWRLASPASVSQAATSKAATAMPSSLAASVATK